MKFSSSQLAYLMGHRETRANLRALLKYLVLLTARSRRHADHVTHRRDRAVERGLAHHARQPRAAAHVRRAVRVAVPTWLEANSCASRAPRSVDRRALRRAAGRHSERAGTRRVRRTPSTARRSLGPCLRARSGAGRDRTATRTGQAPTSRAVRAR